MCENDKVDPLIDNSVFMINLHNQMIVSAHLITSSVSLAFSISSVRLVLMLFGKVAHRLEVYHARFDSVV